MLLELTPFEELGPKDPLRELGIALAKTSSSRSGPPGPPPRTESDPQVLIYLGLIIISSSMVAMWLSKVIKFSTSVSSLRSILTELYFSGFVSNRTIPEKMDLIVEKCEFGTKNLLQGCEFWQTTFDFRNVNFEKNKILKM